MSQSLTWQEISDRYAEEWVLLGDVEFEEPVDEVTVARAVVIAHGRTRAPLLSHAVWGTGRDLAFLFTGDEAPLPGGSVGVLA